MMEHLLKVRHKTALICIPDCCKTLISISKMKLSGNTLMSLSMSTLYFILIAPSLFLDYQYLFLELIDFHSQKIESLILDFSPHFFTGELSFSFSTLKIFSKRSNSRSRLFDGFILQKSDAYCCELIVVDMFPRGSFLLAVKGRMPTFAFFFSCIDTDNRTNRCDGFNF